MCIRDSRKRAEKKARKKDEKRREKMEATASTSSGSGSARAVASEATFSESESISRDGASVAAVRLETPPASTPSAPPAPPVRMSAPPEAAPEKPRAGKEAFAVPARPPRGALKMRGKPKSAFGLTEEQRGWVAVAVALVFVYFFSPL